MEKWARVRWSHAITQWCLASLSAHLLIKDLHYIEKNSRCSRKSRRDEEEGVQDDLQDEKYSDLVGEALDMVCDASKSKRLSGLAVLEKYLLQHAGNAEIEKHESTLESVLFGCLRRGKVDERCRAASVLGMPLLFLHSVF